MVYTLNMLLFIIFGVTAPLIVYEAKWKSYGIYILPVVYATKNLRIRFLANAYNSSTTTEKVMHR